MLRFIPLFLIAILALIYLYFLPVRRFVAYNLNLTTNDNGCCKIEDVLSTNGQFDNSATAAVFDNQVVNYPKNELAQTFDTNLATVDVLGTMDAAGEEKWIDVDLSKQLLTAWEGNKIYMQFPISSGLWNSTPRGTFEIWYKTRYQTMKGGSKELGTYYNLPNVPDNMFFYQNDAIHGAYWHNNFGHPMSHGCINEPLTEAHQLFEWAGPIVPSGQNVIRASPENPGTRVVVH